MNSINFSDRQNDLSPSNIKYIRCLQIRNYRQDLKYHFPPGAIEILSYEADVAKFKDSIDFLMHLLSLRYLSYDEFSIPDNFFTQEHIIESISHHDFFYEANGRLVSFCDFTETKFWSFSLDSNSFVEGFKLIQRGTGLCLIGRSKDSFFGFIYQSID